MATMLDCRRVQPLLSEYVDGALSEETAWDVKMHVASCAVCQRVADDFAGTAELLGNLAHVEPSANFEAMLAARLADLSVKPRRPSLREQVSEWWYARGSVGRPALASAAAFAFVVPLILVTLTLRQGAVDAVNGTAVVKQSNAAASPASDAEALERLYDDHAAYSSSLLLGDSSGVLTTMDSRL